MKPHSQQLEVLPPSITDTVSSLPQVAVLDNAQLAAGIRADIECFERTTREAAFAAMRIGLRLIWVRDNGSRGSLMAFLRDEFKGAQSERTLMRYISIAEKFVKESGLVDRKTHLLTDGAVVSEIVGAQLELFTDPNAKFEGAMKKLMKHVGERGLSDLYAEARRGGNTYDRKDANGVTIKGKGAGVSTPEQLAAMAKDEIINILNSLDVWFKARHHGRISKDLRLQADAILEEARRMLKAVAD